MSARAEASRLPTTVEVAGATEGGRARARFSPFLIFVVGVGALAGFLYGYDTGIISGALLAIRDEFGLDHRMQEMTAAAILVGAIGGSLAGGWLTERVGRRRTLTVLATVYVVGALASSLAPSAGLLIAARIVLGLAVGASSQAVPVYLAELAPANRRGRCVTMFNVAIGLGILSANLVASEFREMLSWRWMIGAAILPAAILCACTFVLPESPRWLVGRDRSDAARRDLARVRPPGTDLDRELGEIERVVEVEKSAPVKGWRGLAQGWVRPAVLAALGIAAFTQLTGIEMMIYYAPTLLTGVGVDHATALRSTLWLGLVYAVMTAIGLAIVDRVGRRNLSLFMLPGAALSLFLLGGLLTFGLAGGDRSWPILACLLAFMFFNAGGIQVVGWLSGSEMYPLSVRAAGTSAQATMVWGSNLVVTASALTLVDALGTGGVMLLYGALNVAAFLFVLRFVPETAGRSLEAIEGALRDGTFRP
ncbi:sugar porter family MFS transporter [Methylobacterium flocculans]|uniref:sugar porter family MFS transporter n=1 Tax=Methylobacterium flocculans TaxID=2984843 RepID=UPI0021F3BE0F|nr:sugar porter family MFS transporter [Methylobacterium sp. FF17]